MITRVCPCKKIILNIDIESKYSKETHLRVNSEQMVQPGNGRQLRRAKSAG
jgi:hypothetical protein